MANIIDTLTAPLKAAGDTAEKLLKVYGILEHGDEFRKLHEDVVAGLIAARHAQAELIAKQEEIDSLKRQMGELKAERTKMDRYDLKELPPGVFVYALREGVEPPETAHYACEKCFGDGKIRRLHKNPGIHNGLEMLVCKECGTELKIGYYQPPQPVRVVRQNPLRR